MADFCLVYITAPNKKEAKKISQILIEEKLAACINFFPIESIYRWQGKIRREKEFGMIVKTKRILVEKIIKRVKEIHSYKVPCIISFPLEKGNRDFLKWIKESTI